MRFCIYILLLFSCYVTGQTSIKGRVTDVVDHLPFVNVILKDSVSKKTLLATTTNEKGVYEIHNIDKGPYFLEFRYLGYKNKTTNLFVESKPITINITLEESPINLNEVVIQSTKSVVIKKDTVIFNAKSFLKGNEQVLEDMLKNIPGIHVDDDGNIKVGNQEIEKVMIDGDDFFEKGYKILTKNMSHSSINKIEILKNYSKNKLLKGIEKSNKVALNLTLKEGAKRTWFGNAEIGYGIGTDNRYSLKGNLMNFGKKNKYYFLGNTNNTGYDITGDIEQLIKPNSFDENISIGDNEKVNSLLSLDSNTPNFKSTRTNFNNAELVSLNAIFNPLNKLKIKTLVFLNWDENDFYRNSTQIFKAQNTNFTNTDFFELRKNKTVGFGKLDITYDISKNKTIEFVTKYNNLDKKNISNLTFNNDGIIENLKVKNTFLDQKITYSNRFKKNKVLLVTARYISEKSPEKYSLNKFLYQNLFPTVTSNNITQINFNKMNFTGIEAHLFNKYKNGNLLEVKFGNKFRKDNLISEFSLKEYVNTSELPSGYQNSVTYFSNDLYLKTKYLLKLNQFSITGSLELHQLSNKLSQHTVKKEHPFFTNPKVSLEWNINKKNKIKTSYSYNTTNAKIIDLYNNYVLTGFRSFSKGIGNFNQLNASSTIFNYQFGNWSNNFFANVFVFYNKQHDFYSTNSTIKQNYSQLNKILIKGKELLSISSSIDRYLKFISCNLKLNMGFSNSNYKNIVNNSDLRELTSSNYDYGFEIRSGFSGFFNYHFGSKWTTTNIKSGFSNSFSNNTSFIDLLFIPSNKLNFDIQAERYSFGNLNNHKSSYYFADFNAKYLFKENKLSVSLIAKNLFNTKNFKESSISDIGSSTTTYKLLPRYFLLKLEYRF
ncbi:TonB-dependent receptor [Tenacibaculum sp.]|nr:TonB-dependent receptor [Tenacibaculum sp.]